MPKLKTTLKEKLVNISYKLYGIALVAYLYSGFADLPRFEELGYRVFVLPVCGLISAAVLYMLAFRLFYVLKVPEEWEIYFLTGCIQIPLLVPFWLMVIIQEKDLGITLRVSFSFVIAFVLLVGLFPLLWMVWIRIRESEKFAVKLAFIFALFVVGYLANKLGPVDPFGTQDIINKYAPIGMRKG